MMKSLEFPNGSFNEKLVFQWKQQGDSLKALALATRLLLPEISPSKQKLRGNRDKTLPLSLQNQSSNTQETVTDLCRVAAPPHLQTLEKGGRALDQLGKRSPYPLISRPPAARAGLFAAKRAP